MVMGMANLAMVTGNIGREGVGVNPLRGQNNVQGSCDMGSFPHEYPGYRHVGRDDVRAIYEQLWGKALDPEPGLRIPNMFDSALAGSFRGLYVQGEDIAQSDPNTQHVEAALRALDLVVVQDLFLNETARFAHVFLPGTSFLEKDGTFTNAERRINRVRPVFPSKVGMDEWEITCAIGRAMGYDMSYASAAEIMDEVAATTPTFAGVSFARLDEVGSMQWPVFDTASTGTPIMHIGEFVRGKGRLVETVFVPTTERSTRKFPLILTTGRILSQYNVGAQTRRTAQQHLASRGRPRDPPRRRRAARHLHRRPGRPGQPGRLHDAARGGLRADAGRRRLHDLPPPGDRRQRGHDGELRLGHQLPGVQGHRRPGGRGERSWGRRGHRDPRARGDPRVSSPVRRADGGPPEARMGNDIARQFTHLPPAEAADAIARHIERFWDPRMRRALEALVAAHDDSLDPLVVDAAGRLATDASRPEPAP